MENSAHTQALDLINSQHIMTLAVAGHEQPWAAPVYYVYSSGCFWFFSSPQSVHIYNAIPGGRAAAVLHSNSSGWKDIRGLQMEGIIEPATMDADSIKAFSKYILRFGFASELLPEFIAHPSIRDFESAFRARWYRFIPGQAYFMDNSSTFGSREPVEICDTR